jgi:Asp-tRNA(Asn)/Glu-tRNA(Gln) amidotransferase A subunit family amidase
MPRATLPVDLEQVTSARHISDAVRARRVSAVAVLDAFADRLHKANPQLNAVIASRLDAARLEAVTVDERVKAGHPVGPLAGVPFTVKDVFATTDLPTTCGSKVLEGHRTAGDAAVVSRLRQAGAILVGKTNCPEFAFGIDTANDLHGRTRNPLGDFTPGGSSGGESAAVAAGMSAFGVGTDFGGSVRWPAQCTGIVGLRPTIGRSPVTGHLPAITDDEPLAPNPRSVQGRFQVAGLLARSVADVSLALEVLSGPDGVDSFAVPVPLREPALVRMENVEVRHGHTLDAQHVANEVTDAVDWAIDALARTGASVAPGLPRQLDAAVGVYSALRRTDPFDEIVRVTGARTGQLTAMVQRLLADVPLVPEREVVKLWAVRDRLVGELTRWLTGDRLLVLPVGAELPCRGADVQGPMNPAQFELLAMSRAVTLFGLPSLSFPCPPAPDGRPVSVQIVGPLFREDLVLAAGRWLEKRRIQEL